MRLKLTQIELGYLFNVSAEQIARWQKRGMPDDSLAEAVKWYFTKGAKPKEDDIAVLKKKILKLQVDMKTGQVISKSKVQDAIQQILSVVKEELLSISGAVSPKLINKTVPQIQDELSAFIIKKLNDMVPRIDQVVAPLEELEQPKNTYTRIGL